MSDTIVTAEQVLDQLARLAPVLTDQPVPQGDIIAIPAAGLVPDATTPIPVAGVPLVRGQGGHVHLLLGKVMWEPGRAGAQTLGTLTVPAGEVACLAHGDGTPVSALSGDAEHGVQLLGPGTWVIRRQRSQADEITLVAD